MKSWLSVLLLLLCSSCLVSASQPISTYELVNKWSAKIPSHSDGTKGVFSDEQNVYTGSYGDKAAISKIRLSDGKVLWSTPTESYQPSNPVSNGKVVVFGTYYKPSVVGLDDATGKELWRVPTGQQMMSAATFADDLVFIGSYDKNVYAVEWATGKTRWKTAVGSRVRSKPHVRNSFVFIGCDDGYLYCIDKTTGETKKKIDCGGAVGSDVQEFGGKLFISAGTLTMGREKKRMSPAEDSQYVQKLHSRMLVVDPDSGKIINEFKTEDRYSFEPKIVALKQYVLFNDRKYLYGYDSNKNSLAWKTHTQDVLPFPILSDGMVVLPGNDLGVEGQHNNNLYVIDPLSGKIAAKESTGGIPMRNTIYTQAGNTVFVADSMTAYEIKRVAPQTKSELDQIAAFITLSSQGKSKLIRGEKPIKSITFPLVVYLVSTPFTTELKGIGKGEVLGAITVLSDFQGPSHILPTAPKGSHLLFFQPGAEGDSSDISLVSVASDGNGNHQFARLMGTTAKRTTADEFNVKGDSPWLSVTYPTADHPSSLLVASIRIVWLLRSGTELENIQPMRYEFDLRIPALCGVAKPA